MYFSDYFGIPESTLEDENVFDVSLVSDLPLFIDPFLIFESSQPEYQALHKWIVDYVRFLQTKSSSPITDWQKREWFYFKEVKQNWLGFSVGTNEGRGLGEKFAKAARYGLVGPVSDFGQESISQGSHIERMFLFADGVGKDGMSDFTANLCKKFLLEFTESFTKKYVGLEQQIKKNVGRAYFDFQTERWHPREFILPKFDSNFVLLTPIDMLTQKIPWINRPDLFDKFGHILDAVDDPQRRGQINTFIHQKLQPPPGHTGDWSPTAKQEKDAYAAALSQYPELANYYVRLKEEDGDGAVEAGKLRVADARKRFRENVKAFVESVLGPKGFFECNPSDLASLSSIFSDALRDAPGFVRSDSELQTVVSPDFELVCTLAWMFDGNKKRPLPAFMPIRSGRNLISFEDKYLSSEPAKDIIAVSAKWQWADTIARLAGQNKLTRIWSVSLEPYISGESVEHVFISYQHDDENWAQWVAEKLVSAGYSVTVQYRDFGVGSNFVEEMNTAVKSSDRTIALLSEKYLKSKFAGAEWQAAFRDDPSGELRKLVPLRIENVSPDGLLGSIVYADLFNKNEDLAIATLFGALSANKRPNETAATFPGQSSDGSSIPIVGNSPSSLSAGLPDSRERIRVSQQMLSLTTEQINFMVWAILPPDNVIPPMSASGRERAKALLDWCFGNGFAANELQTLLDDVVSSSGA